MSSETSASCNCGVHLMAFTRFILSPSGSLSGIALHKELDISSGTFSTLATSFMEFFVAILLYVMICAQFSYPYFSCTHCNTLPRPSSSKSVSISGSEIRSGLRKRSNSKSYFIGSIFVIPRQYATTEPAAEPRPGPTMTPSSSLAEFIKSCTIRK